MLKRKIAAALFALVLLLPFAASGMVKMNAASKITETVNLARPQKNESGPGYYWDNRKDTLTLNGLYIETSDEFGMKIPQNSTVILKGDNYITASRAALGIPGTVIFKGNGTLTLVAEEMGMYFYSTDNATNTRFLNGTYIITSNGDGIVSTNTAISFVDSKLIIKTGGPDFNAIQCRSIKLFGGTVEADNSFTAQVGLEIRGLSLKITSSKTALVCPQKLTFTDVSMKTGLSGDNLVKADAYNGENCLEFKSIAKNLGHSIFFGDNVPKFVDILLLVFVLLILACGIGIPFWKTYQKNKKARAAFAENEKNAKNAQK